MTPGADRELLLRIARDAIVAHVTGTPAPAIPRADAAGRLGGAFVTIHKRVSGPAGTSQELRGCIGHIEADQPLGLVVARCALGACSSDPRFPPVTAAELPDLEVELSLLGPLEPVTEANDIEIGCHGILVEMGWHRGLLLPQVATEWNWDRPTFLAQTCHKAGLARDAWQHGARVWRFEAEVFS